MLAPDTSRIAPRQEALRDALPATVALLHSRRARDIPEADIDAYVALNWLEWQGGSLKLTTTGANICRQMVVRPD
jgi:hypothetical protein